MDGIALVEASAGLGLTNEVLPTILDLSVSDACEVDLLASGCDPGVLPTWIGRPALLEGLECGGVRTLATLL